MAGGRRPLAGGRGAVADGRWLVGGGRRPVTKKDYCAPKGPKGTNTGTNQWSSLKTLFLCKLLFPLFFFKRENRKKHMC